MQFFARYLMLYGALFVGRFPLASRRVTQKRIKLLYGARVLGYAIISAFAASPAACSRAVFISDSAPARVGPDCRGRVYTLNDSGAWILSDNLVEIPEGYYFVSPVWIEDGKK